MNGVGTTSHVLSHAVLAIFFSRFCSLNRSCIGPGMSVRPFVDDVFHLGSVVSRDVRKKR